ncbi:Aldo/keto reductase [Haladaptatus litoreus]|uniref:Aldo/keto reductase n=1 Tax=Haladaptatus litoreus TaxID=553468 RepID=A0A1N7E7T0_9EURY|nr:aldo/keto reductase [Haladaptatus litoreus]SIR84089.1 Aldo/keto reductase [Haladaptatus litoreus]
MEYETIQDTDIPKIGLGTWRMEGATCRNAVATALDLGYRHIDTAQAYGNERQVGQAIRNSDVSRDEVFLTTKVWPMHRKYDAIIDSIHESLARLGTKYVDLLLIHWPNPAASTSEVMRALSDARSRGLTRHIGVSNFDAEQLESAQESADAPILTDQVQFHPYSPQRELLDYCQANDVVLTAYSPLAHGGAMHDEPLATLGTKYGKTPAQVALRWVVQHEGVVTIPKSTSRAHLEENLDIFDFELTETEMEVISRPSRVRTGLSMLRGRFGV